MQRKYKSGAQKRKEKKLRIEQATVPTKTTPSLFSHGFKKQSNLSECLNLPARSPSPSSTSSITDFSPVLLTDENDSNNIEDVVPTISGDNSDMDSHHMVSEDESNTEAQPTAVLQSETASATAAAECSFDIGTINSDHISPRDVENAIKFGPKSHVHTSFPRDCKGNRFPVNIFKHTLKNGDESTRDWL
uniref:Uncharacterized protein n=1 Tax=Amphimedon queenslandica TaxID=400682 RepID=A0A1X7TU39_AMPQE